MGRFVLGLDIGGTTTRCALASSESPDRILVRKTMPTPRAAPERFDGAVASVVEACMREAGVKASDLHAAGCSVCGIVDSGRGIVVDAPNIGWHGVPLARLMQRRWAVPCIVENDVNAAALAECRYGAGRGCRIVAYLTVSTGVAAGIVLAGHLFRGAHHAAGELGYFLPDPRLIDRDWMPGGCLEATSGGKGLARAWAQLRGGPQDADRAREAFEAADAGDGDARRLVRRAADHLAQAAVAIGNLIDPDTVILGGSIALHRPAIHARIAEVIQRTLPFPPTVVVAALGDDAPLAGALLLAAGP